jgi:hypothetical protein
LGQSVTCFSRQFFVSCLGGHLFTLINIDKPLRYEIVGQVLEIAKDVGYDFATYERRFFQAYALKKWPLRASQGLAI